MTLLFQVSESSFLRYFVPLAAASKTRGHRPVFNLIDGGKYNSPCQGENAKNVKQIMVLYGIEQGDSGDVCITIEGCAHNGLRPHYVLTNLLDSVTLYRRYIDSCDYVVFPSKWMSEKCGTISDKNLYLGSPKYDVVYNHEAICVYHGLNPNKSYGLLIYPRAPDLHKTPVDEMIRRIQDDGFIPLLKSRRKDLISSKYNRYRTFYDDNWFPSTTLELIYISDYVLNTDSCTVKEAVMLDKPIYNYRSKNYTVLEELYERNAKRKYLYTYTNSSELILDHMEHKC